MGDKNLFCWQPDLSKRDSGGREKCLMRRERARGEGRFHNKNSLIHWPHGNKEVWWSYSNNQKKRKKREPGRASFAPRCRGAGWGVKSVWRMRQKRERLAGEPVILSMHMSTLQGGKENGLLQSSTMRLRGRVRRRVGTSNSRRSREKGKTKIGRKWSSTALVSPKFMGGG